MGKIITLNNLNRLWQNGVMNVKTSLEGLITAEKTERQNEIAAEKTERQNEIATERERIDELEETSGTVTNKLSTYDDIMTNEVEGYIPDALAVKEGFEQVNDSLEQKTKYEYLGVITNGSGGIPLPDNKTQLLFIVSSSVSDVFKFNFECSVINDGREYVFPFVFTYGKTVDVKPFLRGGLISMNEWAEIKSVEVYAK